MELGEIIGDEWLLAELERNCQLAARMLCDGYSFVRGSDDVETGLVEFKPQLRRIWTPGQKMDYGPARDVYGYWVNMRQEMGRGRLSEEKAAWALDDPLIFGRDTEATTQAFFFAYRAPGWTYFAQGLCGNENLHARYDAILRGMLASGDVLRRWEEADPGWAVSRNGVRAWLAGGDYSEESALALIRRVDDTLSTLARMR